MGEWCGVSDKIPDSNDGAIKEVTKMDLAVWDVKETDFTTD